MDSNAALHSIFDLILIATFATFIFFFKRSTTRSSRKLSALIYIGFSVLVGYYLLDFLILQIAPLIASPEAATQWRNTLNLQLSWPVAMAAVACLLIGFSSIVRQLQRLAKQSEQTALRLSDTIEALPDGLLILDHEERVEQANSAAALMFECRAADLVGKKFAELFYQLKDASIPTHRRLPAVTATGKRFPVEVSTADLSYASGRLALIRDVTHVAALESQLRQAQKMESLGQFAGGIAHDFNNYLTVILGEADLLSLRLNESHKASANRIREASQQAAELTNQLLTFSRKQTLDARVIDLNHELSRLDALLRNLLGKDIDLFCVQDSTLGNVRIDVSQLEQTIINLVINARDAMPEGGKLTIETDNVYLDETFCRTQPDLKPGHYVMLAISDVGVGMHPDVSAHIFEPFYTTKPRGRGTGLGLSMVMGFIQQSEGTVTVESAPDQGTKIRLFLPRVDEPLEKIARLDDVEILPAAEGRICVVEDDDAVREFVAQTLRDHGYQVATYACAEEILAADPLDTDLILTDVVMPDINGFDLAERLLQRNPRFNVLFMTGFIDYDLVSDVASAKHAHILRKPFTVRELLASVQRNLTIHSETRAS